MGKRHDNVFIFISGESGLGKSTLINSLFLTDLYPERIIPGAAGEYFYVTVKYNFYLNIVRIYS